MIKYFLKRGPRKPLFSRRMYRIENWVKDGKEYLSHDSPPFWTSAWVIKKENGRVWARHELGGRGGWSTFIHPSTEWREFPSQWSAYWQGRLELWWLMSGSLSGFEGLSVDKPESVL